MSWLQGLVEDYRKKEGMVDLFGVVLYTDEHAHVKKVLRDDDYWNSFDDISGSNFAIFSIRPQEGYTAFPNLSPGFVGTMVPVWVEPEENKPILDEFCIKDTKRLPLLIVFTHIEDKIAKLEFQLSDSSLEETYNSFKKAIKVIRKALDNIEKENLKNAPGVFAAAALSYNSHKSFELIKKGINFYGWVKGLIP